MEETENTNKKTKRNTKKLLFLIFAGAVSLGLLIIGGFQLIEFSDSTAFCGVLCHKVMYPEYTTYNASPHSRVACAECHVGSGASYLVSSKVSGLPMVWATLIGNYEKPIPTPVKNLRPARETCEQCHRPERFAGDVIRTHTTFATDENNTVTKDLRVLRVGGGESDAAKDIHWHIAAKVWYLPVDDARQDFAWVGVENANGLTEYVDPANTDKITPENVQKNGRLMDCIDCHNRATHIFQSPEQLVDQKMAQGKIDPTLPYIKRESLSVLNPPSTSLEETYQKIEAIRLYYRTNYPKIYATKAADVTNAINQLKEVARLTIFTEMKVNSSTYVDNAGHQTSPGCFRCHGKLLATSGETTGNAIDANCELCHYFELK